MRDRASRTARMERKMPIEISRQEAEAIRDFLSCLEDVAPPDFSKSVLRHIRAVREELTRKIEGERK